MNYLNISSVETGAGAGAAGVGAQERSEEPNGVSLSEVEVPPARPEASLSSADSTEKGF